MKKSFFEISSQLIGIWSILYVMICLVRYPFLEPNIFIKVFELIFGLISIIFLFKSFAKDFEKLIFLKK
jgi:hypothetical protein